MQGRRKGAGVGRLPPSPPPPSKKTELPLAASVIMCIIHVSKYAIIMMVGIPGPVGA